MFRLDKLQENLLYLIFVFLVIPFKKEEYDNLTGLKNSYNDELSNLETSNKSQDKKIKEGTELFQKLVTGFISYIKEQKKYSEDFKYDADSLQNTENYFYIIMFSKRLYIDDSICINNTYIKEWVDIIIALLPEYNSKELFISNAYSYMDYICSLLSNYNSQEQINSSICKGLISTIKDINLEFRHQKSNINFELYNKKLSNQLEEFQKFETKLVEGQEKLENFKKEAHKIKKQVKKSKPIFQLSVLLTSAVSILSAMGILYTANISFKMLHDNQILVAVFLLFMIFVFTLHFIYILQKIFFRSMGEDQKSLNYIDIMKIIVIIVSISFILLLTFVSKVE